MGNQNLSKKQLKKLLREGDLWCSCAEAPAEDECIEQCHVLVDRTTKKVVSSRISWS